MEVQNITSKEIMRHIEEAYDADIQFLTDVLINGSITNEEYKKFAQEAFDHKVSELLKLN